MMTWKPWKPVAMKKVERIDAVAEAEGGVTVLVDLHAGEGKAENDRNRQAPISPLRSLSRSA